MSLSLNSGRSSGGSSDYAGDGIFVGVARIANVVDCSNTFAPWDREQQYGEKDLAVEIQLDVGHETYQPKIWIGGDFKRDNNGVPIDFGWAWKLKELFLQLDVSPELNEDNTLPEAWLDALHGQDVAYISYCKGERQDKTGNIVPAYREWDRFRVVTDMDDEKLNEEKNRLLEFFKKDSSRGYVKPKHTPEIAIAFALNRQEADTDFPGEEAVASNGATTAAPAVTKSPF